MSLRRHGFGTHQIENESTAEPAAHRSACKAGAYLPRWIGQCQVPDAAPSPHRTGSQSLYDCLFWAPMRTRRRLQSIWLNGQFRISKKSLCCAYRSDRATLGISTLQRLLNPRSRNLNLCLPLRRRLQSACKDAELPTRILKHDNTLTPLR